MTITALPTPPSTSDPANFDSRADAFLGALPDFATETNAVAATVNTNATQVAADRVQTGLDKAATAADRVQTGLDAASAAASLDAFDDRYLGAKPSDPTLDNDGNALIVGALYLNTVADEIRKYNGSTWTRLVAVNTAGGNLTGAINEAKGTSVAAAATTNIWATDGNLIHVTGTGGPVTSFGTAPQAGARRTVVIDSAGVVITNGANLVCPEGINIVSSAGDVLEIVADSTTQHRIASYVRGGSRRITGSFTRDITLASGTQVITGLGFRPKAVNFKMLLSSTGGPNMSIGDDDGTNRNCLFDVGGGNYSGSGSFSIYSYGSSGANLYQGLISAISNDGFTITWTKTGSPTGTITIFYDARM